MTRADLIYAARAKRAGAKHTVKTVQEARKAGVPLSWAFALVEQETAPLGNPASFTNIFGHDAGSILHGQRVTRARVGQLLAFVAKGGNSNGVGLTQLTWPPLIRQANRAGGAHKPRVQLRIGFTFYRSVASRDYATDSWKYNGARSYQALLAAKQRKWHKILTKGK